MSWGIASGWKAREAERERAFPPFLRGGGDGELLHKEPVKRVRLA